MNRRKFIRNVGLGGAFTFQGVPMKLFADTSVLQKIAASSTEDRVLVILQMHGGNDGLNTFVPLDQYDLYYSRRANIALPYKSATRGVIPLDGSLGAEQHLGLHPDMHDFKSMYDRGKAAIIQGASYQNNNGSHFRGRDIWFMGGGSDDYHSSGWIGRYLSNHYAPLSYPEEFPNQDMPDPLALEMGNDVSLLFHQPTGIPVSLSLGRNPESLANLIEELQGFTDEGIDPRGLPPERLKTSPYGQEMDWILGLEDKSETYIKRLQEVYSDSPETSVAYPEKYPFGGRRNPLSSQLQLVARLLDGGPNAGVKTKVFLVKIGGFDTHAEQVEAHNTTIGGHGALLYHISSAMKAFQADLAARGLEDRVLTMTMSEFGRRVGSNGSYGTDHGTGGPIMLFGKYVNPGVIGNNPDVTLNNVAMQYDYRQVYASILKNWMGVSPEVINNEIFFGNYLDGDGMTELDLTVNTILGADFLQSRYHVGDPYPNPAVNHTTLDLTWNRSETIAISVIDLEGKEVKQLTQKVKPGKSQIQLDLKELKRGTYFVQINASEIQTTKKIIVRP